MKMTTMVTIPNLSGAFVILGLFALMQSSGSFAEIDLKTSLASQLLVSSKCLFGPSYWCKSIFNAVNCKAVKHCIQTTWRTQKHAKYAKGPSCLACKKGVDLILKEFKNHYSKDRLIKDLDKVCDILVNPRRISQCKSKIDSVMPLIIDSANEVVNSQSICFTLKLCLTPFVDTLENEKEATINFEKVNTDDQNKQIPKDRTVLNFKPEMESSFFDVVFRRMHTTDAVDGPTTLLDDQNI